MNEPMPVALPPGFFGNGTPYSAGGRYADGNLVRFVNGFARPVGGWQRRVDSLGDPLPALFADPDTEAARTSIGWVDNSGGTHIAVGTNLGLYAVEEAGTVIDITPAGFVGGIKDSALIVGYGTGFYGAEAYGTPRTGVGAPLQQVASWSFSLFGQVLLAQFRNDGPLYKWTPGDALATEVTTAPDNAQGVLVTAERMAMTIKRQPRLIEWSASEDYTNWTPAITNTAGSITIAGVGELQAIVQVGREILVLSTEDAWIGRYIGAPFIYGFEQLGQNCGCLAPNSVTVTNGRAYWYGRDGFWTYDGTVRRMETDIEDYLTARIQPSQITKMSVVELPGFREIWWWFQSYDADECDSYVAFNHIDNTWVWGTLDRSTGVPPGVSLMPVFIGTDGFVYNHDLPGVVVPSPAEAFVETGPLELGQGGRQVGIQYFFPDLAPGPAAASAAPDPEAELYILGVDFPSPQEVERVYGPYPLNRPTPTTGARGRSVRLRYVGKNANWRVGKNRITVVPMGGR